MSRKILTIFAALMAFGALAVVPSMASAALTLQDTEGGVTKKVEPGKKIVADSTGVSVLKAGEATVECNENIMTGTVDKNDSNEIQGTIEDAWFQSNLTSEGTLCKSSLGNVRITIPGLTNETGGTKHWCVRTVPGTDKWQLWGNNCTTEPGTGELTFVLDFSFMTCRYKRTAVVEGTFNTTNTHEALKLTMTGEPEFTKEEVSGFLCPAAGKLSNFVFDLYTDGAETTNKYGTQPTANPLFITPEA